MLSNFGQNEKNARQEGRTLLIHIFVHSDFQILNPNMTEKVQIFILL